MGTTKYHTLGVMALRCGASPHHLFRLARAGRIPHEKIDRLHVFRETDEETIREVLREAGYISTPAATLEIVPA